jgi:hypothetical protein
LTEEENVRVNAAMVRNVLQELSGARSVFHVALVTGLKHYLGPFESYGKGKLPATPFREEQPRLDIENFYYAQEDELYAAATRDGFSWSVHRPHTIIGYAIGNAMNMGTTLAVYSTICRRPIEVVTDMSKSRKLGFLDYQATDDSFFDLFSRLRVARIIP